ncbi:MAG: response regulator [Planctomycetes bacterium]|nr:response regulator [Planctomycetota bacterium]
MIMTAEPKPPDHKLFDGRSDGRPDDALTRVLLVSPTRRDGEITSSLLANAGVICVVCEGLTQVIQEMQTGAGVVLLTEEMIRDGALQELLKFVENQPAWSDLPFVILMQGGITSGGAAKVLRGLRNVTLLERPAPTRSVVSAVQAAIRGRERQYQIRDQIEAIRIGQQERLLLLESERAARQEAERASRIKDEFLATLGHELRTPLNAIFGWSQLMKLSPGDASTIAEGIGVIDRNVRLQTQLIEDLLDMSRIISGKVRLDVQRVDLAEVIDAALQSVMPALAAKEIRLQKVVDAAIGSVSGDPGRLQQVLWNLLTNSVKFTPKGGSIQVLAERVLSHVDISISDSGEGIDPQFLPQLFERFTQADASTTRKHGGLGLGLSIVRNLVEMHGGTVRAHSPGIGHGATFIIRLPLRVMAGGEDKLPPGPPVAGPQAAHDLSRLRGLKVLVIDDESDARELVRRFLVECEAIPTLAGSAAEARSLLATFQPDVIISDIGMPNQDGYEFMRSVRALGLNMPAIALTAFARADDRIRSMQAGFQTHLPKPVDPRELIAVVASLAGRYDVLK